MRKYLYLIFVCFFCTLFVACDDSVDHAGKENILSNDTEVVTEYYTFPEQETETEETEESAVPTESIASAEQEKLPEEAAPIYTYKELDQIMYARQSVNVRNLPGVEGDKVGALSYAQEITVTGQCNETSWYRVNYGGAEAFVSDQYLTDQKPVMENVTQEQIPANSNSNAASVENSTPSYENHQNGGTSVTVPEAEETGENLVWVPIHGGTKYHSTSSCSNMIDPMQVSKETAIANGYEPCKRCH